MAENPDYQFFFENLSTAAVIADDTGSIHKLNRAALELLENHEIEGLRIFSEILNEFRAPEAEAKSYPICFFYDDRTDPLLDSFSFMGRLVPGGGADSYFFILFYISSVMEAGAEGDGRAGLIRSKSPLMWAVDTDFNYISFNEIHRQEMKQVWGADIHPGDNLLGFLKDERYRRLVIYNYNRALSGEHFYTIDELKEPGGASRFFENVLGPVVDEEGRISGLRVRTTELTDYEDVKDRLQMSFSVQRSLIEGYGSIRIASLDRFFRFRAFNDGYRRFMNEIRGVRIRIGSSLLDSLASDAVRHEVKHKLETVLKGESLSEIRSYPLKEGEVVYYEHDYFPVLSETGDVIGLTLFSADVTEQMNQKAEIKEALAEKEILLREIHFRVKNNLQMISSLMNLQMGYTPDGESDGTLQDLFARVQTLSLIHEQLYQGASLGSVRSREFFTSMAAMLIELRGFNTAGIRIRKEIEDLEFDLDTAIPLGLIFNELLDNALGHGFYRMIRPVSFPEDEPGTSGIPAAVKEVVVTVSEEKELIRMAITNRGGLPWRPEEPSASFGLGLKLASTLAEQLGGELDFDFSDGTTVSLGFKRSEGA